MAAWWRTNMVREHITDASLISAQLVRKYYSLYHACMPHHWTGCGRSCQFSTDGCAASVDSAVRAPGSACNESLSSQITPAAAIAGAAAAAVTTRPLARAVPAGCRAAGKALSAMRASPGTLPGTGVHSKSSSASSPSSCFEFHQNCVHTFICCHIHTCAYARCSAGMRGLRARAPLFCYDPCRSRSYQSHQS